MGDSVWLVDDTESALDILKLFLEKEGFPTVTYSCPLKALHDLEQGHKPSLVVTDYNMPEMMGTDFLNTVHSFLPEIPAIFITGDPDSIPNQFKHIPAIEKGTITFIKDLIEKIKSTQAQPEKPENNKKNIKNERKIRSIPKKRAISRRKKIIST